MAPIKKKIVIKKAPVKKAPIKKVVSAKKPSPKTIVKKAEPVKKKETTAKGLAIPANKRILTGEGVRRRMLRDHKK